jgi:hypothetical protein
MVAGVQCNCALIPDIKKETSELKHPEQNIAPKMHKMERNRVIFGNTKTLGSNPQIRMLGGSFLEFSQDVQKILSPGGAPTP